MRHARQTLVSYALFEGARARGKPIQYALLPLILPSISGRAGQPFSADDLATQLQQLFGAAFNAYDAEALVPMLEVEGYVKRELDDNDAAVFTYTEAANDINIDDSVVSAEKDVELIIDEFLEFLSATRPLVRFTYEKDEWKSQFVQWATSVDTADVKGFQAWIDNVISAEKANTLKLSGNEEPEEKFLGIDRHTIVVFASFVQWLSKNKPELFDKVVALVEIGLVLDLVSALRQPIKPKSKIISLTAVLDGPILLNALGLSGRGSQEAALSLLKLCAKHEIRAITLQHCVDEAREVVRAVLDNSPAERTGILADAIRVDQRLEGVSRRFIAAPDKLIKEKGIQIINASQITNHNEKEAFSEEMISEFADRLPYSNAVFNQRRKRRDAQSVGFVMRRRGGRTTSDLYESKYVLITRSTVLSKFSGRFMTQKIPDYPEYAVLPAIEARHFSTMFLLNFGTDLGEQISRGELLSSCERVLRTSPEMVRKVRESMEQLSLFPPEELEALMNDPVALYEVITVTGNDPSVISVENAAALAELMRNSAAKTERINRAKAEKEISGQHQRALDEVNARTQEQIESERARAAAAENTAEGALVMAAERDEEIRVLAEGIYEEAKATARAQWVLVAIAFTVVSIGAFAEIFLDLTKFPTWLRISIALCLAAVAIYSWASRVLKKFSLIGLREWLLKREVRRRMAKTPGLLLRTKIAELSGIAGESSN